MTNDTRLTQLWEAVEAERIEEEQFYAGFMEAKTLKEKAETGYAWYPIQFTSSQHTINDYLEVKIERTGEISGSGKFREGSGVQLILVRSGEKETLRGTISRLTKKQMWLLCKSDDIDDLDLPLSSANAVELIYDERPYLIMKDALTQVKSNQKEAIVKLKKFIYDKDARQKVDDYQLQLTHDSLNEGQRAAIAYAMGSAAMGVIHGPPGTGKTTTLIGLIQEVLSHEDRVLVCASSNHAVDLLAAKCLDAGLSTLRLGNVSRISEKVMEASLNEKVRNNKNWPQIKKWRIEADEIRKKRPN
ncbi:MAG: AAA family ATPase [Saprospiraceae bacterium]|nr:AAA family ATPase [Saprospiraceae bacterium]